MTPQNPDAFWKTKWRAEQVEKVREALDIIIYRPYDPSPPQPATPWKLDEYPTLPTKTPGDRFKHDLIGVVFEGPDPFAAARKVCRKWAWYEPDGEPRGMAWDDTIHHACQTYTGESTLPSLFLQAGDSNDVDSEFYTTRVVELDGQPHVIRMWEWEDEVEKLLATTAMVEAIQRLLAAAAPLFPGQDPAVSLAQNGVPQPQYPDTTNALTLRAEVATEGTVAYCWAYTFQGEVVYLFDGGPSGRNWSRDRNTIEKKKLTPDYEEFVRQLVWGPGALSEKEIRTLFQLVVVPITFDKGLRATPVGVPSD